MAIIVGKVITPIMTSINPALSVAQMRAQQQQEKIDRYHDFLMKECTTKDIRSLIYNPLAISFYAYFVAMSIRKKAIRCQFKGLRKISRAIEQHYEAFKLETKESFSKGGLLNEMEELCYNLDCDLRDWENESIKRIAEEYNLPDPTQSTEEGYVAYIRTLAHLAILYIQVARNMNETQSKRFTERFGSQITMHLSKHVDWLVEPLNLILDYKIRMGRTDRNIMKVFREKFLECTKEVNILDNRNK